MEWNGMEWNGMEWSGMELNWIELNWMDGTGLDETGLDGTEQETALRNDKGKEQDRQRDGSIVIDAQWYLMYVFRCFIDVGAGPKGPVF